MSAPRELPMLMDRRAVAAELGVSRAVVDAVFRACPVVALPNCRRVFVRRFDVLALLEQSTFPPGERVR